MLASKTPIARHISEYLNYAEIEQGLSKKTIENYGRFLGKFKEWLKEKSGQPALLPHNLTSDHIFAYKTFLSRSGASAADPDQPLKKTTQNYYLIALRSLLKYFAEKDIRSLPADKIKLLRDKDDRQIKVLKLPEVEHLLETPSTETIDGLRDRAILETLFSTGLRVAELTALSREQFKIKPGVEYLEIAVRGKGGRVRTVYFSPRAVQALRAYLHNRKDTDPALFISYSPRTQVGEERRLTVRSIQNIVKKYLKIAGLPVMMSPHSLRHSYATDLLANGVDVRLVQEFLGHRNIATTQIYTHVTNKRLYDVHKKFHGGNKLNK